MLNILNLRINLFYTLNFCIYLIFLKYKLNFFKFKNIGLSEFLLEFE